MFFDITKLTLCEYHTIALAAKGYRMKEIAKMHDRSPKTVEKHITNVKRKFQIRGGVMWMGLLRMFPGP